MKFARRMATGDAGSIRCEDPTLSDQFTSIKCLVCRKARSRRLDTNTPLAPFGHLKISRFPEEQDVDVSKGKIRFWRAVLLSSRAISPKISARSHAFVSCSLPTRTQQPEGHS